MLEIRYNKTTKELTGWWGSRHGNEEVKLKNRPNERLALLDIPIPDKPLDAWLFNTNKLIPNPNYIEPTPPRDLVAEIDDLKAKIKILESR
ncbi:hypothetical protein LCGC14_3119290 [marine sediment metagenome]|uniref:Uncharacterized protein n=1 Tax=marine sediment metagenome TaxID=412755 RepID=A0A0F8YA99_9ZZZZ